MFRLVQMEITAKKQTLERDKEEERENSEEELGKNIVFFLLSTLYELALVLRVGPK